MSGGQLATVPLRECRGFMLPAAMAGFVEAFRFSMCQGVCVRESGLVDIVSGLGEDSDGHRVCLVSAAWYPEKDLEPCGSDAVEVE